MTTPALELVGVTADHAFTTVILSAAKDLAVVRLDNAPVGGLNTAGSFAALRTTGRVA